MLRQCETLHGKIVGALGGEAAVDGVGGGGGAASAEGGAHCLAMTAGRGGMLAQPRCMGGEAGEGGQGGSGGGGGGGGEGGGGAARRTMVPYQL